jgi:hypothetical protein
MQAQTKKPFVAPTLKNEASLTQITLSGSCDLNTGIGCAG